MNTRDRDAWAKALGSALLPSPTGESGRIVIPGRGPSKANTYEIRIDPTLWSQIKPIVEQWRKKTGKRQTLLLRTENFLNMTRDGSKR